MKKYFLLILLTMTFCAYSQDVIITKNAEKLEVKIIEVSSSEIKYKKLNNLEGPTFVLSSSEIATIIYENGDIQTFEDKSLPKNIEEATIVADKYISRSGNSYFYDGVTMRGNTYKNFLNKNCIPAYQEYKKGETIATWGWALLGVGVGFDIGFSWWLSYSWVPALACEIACIPTLIVGYNKMHKSADIYNTTCAKKRQTQAYWSVNASQNGIGLAFNF